MQLAKPGDPLVAEDGRIIESSRRVEPDYSISVPIAKNLVSKSPRSVREMSTDGQTQTVVNAVLVYHILGVSKNEMAHLLGTSGKEIDAIMQLNAFQETYEMLFHEFISTNSSSIQSRIAAYAGRAFDNLMDLADSKPKDFVLKDDAGNLVTTQRYDVNPMVIMKSNEGILDRAGLSEETLYGKQAQSSAPQLEIVISSAEDVKTDVKITTKGGR